MKTLFFYLAAAFFEIAGSFAFWAWLRLGKSPWWSMLGALCLVVFAVLLTKSQAFYAGRAFAAYGGVYIASSLAWLYLIENTRPDKWDLLGATVTVLGAAIILFGPREVPAA